MTNKDKVEYKRLAREIMEPVLDVAARVLEQSIEEAVIYKRAKITASRLSEIRELRKNWMKSGPIQLCTAIDDLLAALSPAKEPTS